MPEFIILIVTVLTLIVITAVSFMFLRKTRGKDSEMEFDLSAFEDRVLELISKFQHISSSRLSAMENKIDEMNKVLKEANEMYFKLSSILSDTTKKMSEMDNRKINTNAFIEAREQSDEIKKTAAYSPPFEGDEEKFKTVEENIQEEVQTDKEKQNDDHFTFEEEFNKPLDLKNSSLEHKIMNLSSEGVDSSEIARTLGIGKGEVELVLGLFKRKYS